MNSDNGLCNFQCLILSHRKYTDEGNVKNIMSRTKKKHINRKMIKYVYFDWFYLRQIRYSKRCRLIRAHLQKFNRLIQYIILSFCHNDLPIFKTYQTTLCSIKNWNIFIGKIEVNNKIQKQETPRDELIDYARRFLNKVTLYYSLLE